MRFAVLSLALFSRPAAALLVPPQLHLTTQVNAADEGSGTLRLYDALRALSSKYPSSSTCLTASGKFMGRLSNTVSMLNEAAKISVNASKIFNASINLVFPEKYTVWWRKESLDTLFSREPRCQSKAVSVYDARCPPRDDHKDRCDTVDMLVNTASNQTKGSTFCNCDRLVYLPTETMLWNHRFEWTHSIFQKRYWDVHEPTMLVPGTEISTPGSMPAQAVMHMRLGDIESNCSGRFTPYNCNKKLKADLYVSTVQALLAVLPARCTQLNIVTDGQLDSPDVVHVRESLNDSGLSALRIWTADELPTVGAFNLMTHADVLIYGASGFGQVAAIVAKPETARLGNPLPRTQVVKPFTFLPNTSQLLAKGDGSVLMSEAIRDVKANAAIQALAEACSRRG